MGAEACAQTGAGAEDAGRGDPTHGHDVVRLGRLPAHGDVRRTAGRDRFSAIVVAFQQRLPEDDAVSSTTYR